MTALSRLSEVFNLLGLIAGYFGGLVDNIIMRVVDIMLALPSLLLALVLVVSGWKMTGQLAGLGIMLVGVALLLAVLAIYNATYQD